MPREANSKREKPNKKIIIMKNRASLAFLIFMSTIILLHADLINSSSDQTVNATFSAICSDCLVGGDDLDAEFSVSHHFGRMLATNYKAVTGNTGNGNRAAVDCPSKQGYRTCVPSKNPGPRQRCDTYTRDC